MEKTYHCENCTTVVTIDMGMKEQYYGPTIKCGRCDSLMVLSSFVFTPHIVPTRPVRTLYWTGTLTTFPPLTVEPLIVEDFVHWTFPNLPNIKR